MTMPKGAYSSQQMQEKRPHGFSQYKINNYTPEQQKLFQQSFDQVSPDSYTGRLASGDEELYKEMEAPALKQFSALQGGLGSRYSQMGTGATRSSGFRNDQNQQAQDFAMQLQSNRQGLQRQAIQDLRAMSDSLLNQRPQEKGYVEKPHKETWGDTALKWYTAYKGGNNSGGGGEGLMQSKSSYEDSERAATMAFGS